MEDTQPRREHNWEEGVESKEALEARGDLGPWQGGKRNRTRLGATKCCCRKNGQINPYHRPQSSRDMKSDEQGRYGNNSVKTERGTIRLRKKDKKAALKLGRPNSGSNNRFRRAKNADHQVRQKGGDGKISDRERGGSTRNDGLKKKCLRGITLRSKGWSQITKRKQIARGEEEHRRVGLHSR